MEFVQVWRFTTGFLGTLSTIAVEVFSVPIPVLLQFNSNRSVGEHPAETHLPACLTRMYWILYGLPFVRPNSIFVIIANGAGCFIAMFYLLLFVIYSKSWQDKRGEIAAMLLIEIITIGIIGAIEFMTAHDIKSRYFTIGRNAMVSQIVTNVASLFTWYLAISANKMELINEIHALANFCNYILWVSYAAVPFDPYLLVPNALGIILSFTQAVLYKRYHRKQVHGIDLNEGSAASALQLFA